MLFDFCALVEDEDVPADDRFMAQAAVVGEVEWNRDRGEVDKDFEKLLIADSLVLFMTFQSPTVEDGKKIDSKLRREGGSNTHDCAV
jgi:hypothetical protein